MPSARSIQQLRRTLRLAHTLATKGPSGVAVGALAADFGASRATLYRDLKHLRDAGFEVESCDVDGQRRMRLRLDHRLPAPGPDFREQLALKLVRAAIPSLEHSFVAEVLDALLRPSNAARKVRASGVRKTGPAAEILDTIARAIRTKRRLTFRYRGANDRADEPRVVDPVELRLVRDQLYLVAFDLERNAARTFKPVRMTAAFVSPEPANKRDIDVEALLAASVRVWSGPHVEVVVRLAQDKARFVTEWPLHAEQRLEAQADGSVLVRATVTGIVEAVRWVLGWGDGAVAVEPEALRDAVVGELERALAGYLGAKKRGARGGVSREW